MIYKSTGCGQRIEKLINHNVNSVDYRGCVGAFFPAFISPFLSRDTCQLLRFFRDRTRTKRRRAPATVINLRPRCRCDISEMSPASKWVTVAGPTGITRTGCLVITADKSYRCTFQRYIDYRLAWYFWQRFETLKIKRRVFLISYRRPDGVVTVQFYFGEMVYCNWTLFYIGVLTHKKSNS